MRRLLLVAAFLALIFTGNCLGMDAENAEWEAKHADEAYLMLYQSVHEKLNRDGSYIEDIHWIKKIHNEDAMDLGEISLFYDKKRQTLSNIKAYITTPDGKKHRYSMIQDVGGEYSDQRNKIITMPNVVKGSIIECKYSIINKYDLIKGEYSNVIPLYSMRPLNHYLFTLDVPDDMEIYFKKINTKRSLEASHANGTTTYKVEFKNDDIYDEKYSSEEYALPAIDSAPFILVSTMKDWGEFSKWYWEIFSKNMTSNAEIKAEAEKLIKDKTTKEDKIMAIAKYLYQDIRYLQVNFNDHNYEPHPAVEVFKNKFGDCKDQTVLFATMLKEIGIGSYPAIVRAYTAGNPAPALPDPSVFSHLILAVRLDGKLYFVDPLLEGYRINETPLSLEGSYVLIADGKNDRFIELPFMDLKDKTDISRSDITLAEDGFAKIKTETIFNRQDSIDKRRVLRTATEESKKKFMAYLENLTQGGKIINHEIIGQDDEFGFLTVKMDTENPQYIKPRGSVMIFGYTTMDMTQEFYYKERKYPIWLSDENRNITITNYTIPEGFIFEYVPKDLDMKSEWMDIGIKYKKYGKKIRQEVDKYYKRAIVLPSRYQEFKDFLQKAERGLDECIIIRKVK